MRDGEVMDCTLVIQEAQCLIATGLQTKAADLLEEHLRHDGAAVPVLHMLARIRMLQGRPQEAVPLLKEALRIQTDSRQASTPRNSGTSERQTVQVGSCLLYSGPETLDDEELTLIEDIANYYGSRRHFFDHRTDDCAYQHEPERHALPKEDPPAQQVPLETMERGDSPSRIKADEGKDIDSDGLARATTDERPSSTHQLESATEPRPSEPPSLSLTKQLELDYESPDDNWEDDAQAEFEKNLENALASADFDDGELDEDDEGLEALHDVAAAPWTADLDWEEFAFDADDFEEVPTRSELVEIQAEGRLTRRQRARQHAIELGQFFDWDDDGIALLTEVFDRYCWSAAKVSMRRELHAGMQPEELRLALELRELWTSHTEFSTDFSRLDSYSLLQSASSVYQNLSWPLALSLVRSPDGYADVECIEHFLCELFDEWYTQESVRRRLQSFHTYLYFRLGIADQQLDDWQAWTFEPDDALGFESDDDYHPGYCTPEYQVLNRIGAIPNFYVTPRDRLLAKAATDNTANPTITRIEKRRRKPVSSAHAVWEGNRLVTRAELDWAAGAPLSGTSPEPSTVPVAESTDLAVLRRP
jgi:hypothetical protein